MRCDAPGEVGVQLVESVLLTKWVVRIELRLPGLAITLALGWRTLIPLSYKEQAGCHPFLVDLL